MLPLAAAGVKYRPPQVRETFVSGALIPSLASKVWVHWQYLPERRRRAGMAESSSIFRREALEHRARDQKAGEIVRLAPRWTNWVFGGLLILFVSAVVAASVVEIDRYATGTVAVETNQVVVLLPSSLAPEVEVGSPAEIGDTRAEVISFRQTVLYPSEAQERYGIAPSVPSVVAVTDEPASDSLSPSARVLVQSDPIIVALIPGLDALLGGE
jgi:hypothetical protein